MRLRILARLVSFIVGSPLQCCVEVVEALNFDIELTTGNLFPETKRWRKH